MRALRGALVVGSPDEVIEKILFQHELFGHDRFLAQMSVGNLPTPRSCVRSSCSEPKSLRPSERKPRAVQPRTRPPRPV